MIHHHTPLTHHLAMLNDEAPCQTDITPKYHDKPLHYNNKQERLQYVHATTFKLDYL